jgi:hypothetical protein
MSLPEDYQDATTPTGALTELPATTSRGINQFAAQINASLKVVGSGSLIFDPSTARPAGAEFWYWPCAPYVVPANAITGDVIFNAASVTIFTDNFASESAIWSGWSASAVVASNQLQLTSTTGYTGAITTATPYDLTHRTFTAEVPQVAGTNITTNQTTMYVGVNPNNWPLAGGFAILVQGTSIFARSWVASGTGTDDLGITTYSPTNHLWWRIRFDATTIYAETSPDSSTWTLLYSEAAPCALTSVYPGFAVGYSGGTAPTPTYSAISNVSLVMI